MPIKETIEKQFFIMNFYSKDIADVMYEPKEYGEEYDEDKVDKEHMEELLQHEDLNLKDLDGTKAYMKYDRDDRKFILSFDNGKIYPLSLLEYLDRPVFKKMISYFLGAAEVTIINPSPQIGGYIDKNYGIKFNVKIGR